MSKKQNNDLAYLQIIPGLVVTDTLKTVIDSLFDKLHVDAKLSDYPHLYQELYQASFENERAVKALLPAEKHQQFEKMRDTTTDLMVLTEKISFAKGVVVGIMLASTQGTVNDICRSAPVQKPGGKNKPGPSAA